MQKPISDVENQLNMERKEGGEGGGGVKTTLFFIIRR